jgi:TolB-like protein
MTGEKWALALAIFTAALSPCGGYAQTVDYQKVTANGIDKEYDAALTSALSAAVAQVNGVAVARKLATVSVHGTATEVVTTKAAMVGAAETRRSAAAIEVVGAQDDVRKKTDNAAQATSSSETRTVAAAGVAEEVDQTQVAAVEAGARVTNQDFQSSKSVVSLATETSGVVNRYQILSAENEPDGWHVSVLAEIAVYKSSQENWRKKIVVLPMRLEKDDENSKTFENAFRTGLVNQLTQSSKLAVLDRDFTGEKASELDFLRGDSVKKEELARLGNQLGADFIVVGVVNEASVKTESVYLQSVGRTVTGASTASAKISYRIIETATGRIELADSWTATGKATKLADSAALASEEIAHGIVDALFPLRIEHLANGVFYLGQGGKTVTIGQRFRVVKLGAEIVDDYTKEIIGREEDDAGTIEVFEVETKLSKARMVGNPLIPLSGDTTGLVARLMHQTEPSAATADANGGKKAQPVKANPSDAKALLDKNQENF